MDKINGSKVILEKEVKVLLSESKYLELANYFIWNEEFIQTNYYYGDEEGFLSKNNITVRVRKKDLKLKLQIKYPVHSDKALHVKNEYSEEINNIPDIIPYDKLLECCEIKVSGVRKIGKLTTLRKIYKWNDTTTICLDKNDYLERCDYEVEVEYIDDLDQNLIKLFDNLGIGFDKNVNGKCSRFFEQYKITS